MAGGALDPRLLSSRKIERLDCPPIPLCHAFPGGRKAAPTGVQTRRPPQRATKGPTPRFIPPVGLGRCPLPRRAANALKRGHTGGTARGPPRRCGAAPWVALDSAHIEGPLGCSISCPSQRIILVSRWAAKSSSRLSQPKPALRLARHAAVDTSRMA